MLARRDSFNPDLNTQDVRQKIKNIVQILMNLYYNIVKKLITRMMREGSVTFYYASHKNETSPLFDQVRKQYTCLAQTVQRNQYYHYHDQWSKVTRNLCYLATLTCCMRREHEPIDPSHKEHIAQILGIKNTRDEGFHLDLDDYLLGLLKVAQEITALVIKSFNNHDIRNLYVKEHFIKILPMIRPVGHRPLKLKNELLRKRFDNIKYDLENIKDTLRRLFSEMGIIENQTYREILAIN